MCLTKKEQEEGAVSYLKKKQKKKHWGGQSEGTVPCRIVLCLGFTKTVYSTLGWMRCCSACEVIGLQALDILGPAWLS